MVTVFVPEAVKRRAHIRISLFIGIALSVSAEALASDMPETPYHEIASRNSFGLKALEHPNPSKPPVVSRPVIRLAGITTILGRKMAFLIIIGSEPGRLRECLVLAEGQRHHEIEVKEIDAKLGIVKVLNHGEEQTLDFDHTGDRTSNLPPVCVSPPPNPSLNPNPLSPEEQTVLIEAQRLKAVQDGDSIAKILPPTEHTQEVVDVATGAASSQAPY